MRKILFILVFIIVGVFPRDTFAGVITTPCPDDEGGGKYNHCTPEFRGCDSFEFNRDGDGNTNQDCTEKIFPSGTKKAICCQLKPMSSYPPGDIVDPYCPTIRSDGHMNYCVPGNSCGSYTPVTAPGADDACKEYYYEGASAAKCCRSTFTIPVGSASGSASITGKFYLDANNDEAFNTGDTALDAQLVSVGTGQSDTTDASGDYELTDVPTGGNTITFKFDKNGNTADLKTSISVVGSSMVFDFPLSLDKVGGSGGGSTPPATPSSGMDIKSIIDSVSESRIREYMKNLVDNDDIPGDDESQSRWSIYNGEGGRPGGNRVEAEYIKKHFSDNSIAVESDEFSVSGIPTNNIVATIPGVDTSKIYLVTSHMDSRGDANSGGSNIVAPGADDNASGTVAVMETARVIKESGITPKRTIQFITFSGEEQGLFGSEHYVASKPRVTGVINADMIGNSTGVECVGFGYKDTVSGSQEIALKLEEVITKYDIGLDGKAEPTSISASDHAPFWRAGIGAVFVTECAFSPFWHKPTDTTNNLNYSQITKTTKAMTAAVLELANE